MYIHVDVEYVRNLRFNGFNFFLLGFTQHASFSCFSDQSRKVQCCAHYLWICDEGQVSLVKGMLKLCIILYCVRTAFQNKNKTKGGKTFEQYCTHNLHVSSCEVSPLVFNLQYGLLFIYHCMYLVFKSCGCTHRASLFIRYAGVTWLWMRDTEWRTITVN